MPNPKLGFAGAAAAAVVVADVVEKLNGDAGAVVAVGAVVVDALLLTNSYFK